MSDSEDSDCSLSTQDMEALQALEATESPIEAPESPIEATESPTETPIEIPIEAIEARKTEKPKRGRPKGTKNNKIETETIVKKVVKIPKSKLKAKKQNIVYVVEEDDGSIREINKNEIMPKRKLTKKEAMLIENEQEAEKLELEHGKQLCRTKKKKVDKRSTTRTAAQIAATKRLVEMNKNRRLKRLQEDKSEIKQAVTEVIQSAVQDKTPVRKPTILKPTTPKRHNHTNYMSDFV